jgi:hypothetical protein
MKTVMTASSPTSICGIAVATTIHPAGQRHGGLARWGTSLAGVVVAVVATTGLAWASGLNPVSSTVVGGQAVRNSATAIQLSVAPTPNSAGMYPGASADVAVILTNHHSLPIRVRAVRLPSNRTYASGYRNAAHTIPVAGCTAANSGVTWRGSGPRGGTVHALDTPLVIGPHQSLSVLLTNGAQMSTSSPAACEGSYFAMPSLGIIGSRANIRARSVTRPVDSWSQ